MIEQVIAQLTPYLTFLGVEPWKQAVIVVVLFFIAAWALGYVINAIIAFFANRTKSMVDERILEYLRRPLTWTLFMLGMVYAGHVSEIDDAAMQIVTGIIASIIILLWAAFAVKVIKLMLRAISNRADEQSLIRNETLPLFNNMMGIFVYAAAVYMLFHAWGINMTAWLASAGVVGIAVGFAAKDTLANLISGVFIMADTPYKIGDYVVLDDNVGDNSRGKITHIGIRSTRMLTRDDVEVIVPNSIMGNSKIVNQTGGVSSKFRLRVCVGVAYGTSTELTEEVLLIEANKEPLVCKYPMPRVRFRSFGHSSLDYELLCWVEDPELRGRVLHQLNTNIYNAFKQNNIEIPYTKQDIYIKSMPQNDEA